MLISYERRLSISHPLSGSGTYFEAYKAVEEGLERPVFLKIAKVADNPVAAQVVEAHVRHWRALATETIPYFPKVLDMNRHEGRWFLSTEWFDAPALSRTIQNPQSVEEPSKFVFTLFERSLSILSAFHAVGFVHGDISFGNILAAPQETTSNVYLVDPAPQLDLPDPNDSSRRLILGNRAFMAPEVLAGRPLTARSDLYSLGKLILELARILGVSAPSLASRLIVARPQERPATAEQARDALHIENSHPSRPANAPSQSDKTVLIGVPRQPDPEWSAVSMAMSVPIPMHEAPGAPASNFDVPTAIASVPAPEKASTTPEPVNADFSVMAPNHIQAGRNFVVEVWVAQSYDHGKMLAEATRSGRMIERGHRSQVEIARQAIITVMLKLPDFDVADPIEVLGWNGSIRNVGFIVKAPADLAPGLYPGAVKLMFGQVPFASILFDLNVSSEASADEPRELSTRFQRVKRAFASYASQDRGEVLRRVQGIEAVGTNVFLDIIALRSGENWERALYREIDASDRFFLFWSQNAAQSDWVEREWRYALDHRGLEFIDPLPLEDPRQIPPPKELNSKHFHDMMLAFITAEDAIRTSLRKEP